MRISSDYGSQALQEGCSIRDEVSQTFRSESSDSRTPVEERVSEYVYKCWLRIPADGLDARRSRLPAHHIRAGDSMGDPCNGEDEVLLEQMQSQIIERFSVRDLQGRCDLEHLPTSNPKFGREAAVILTVADRQQSRRALLQLIAQCAPEWTALQTGPRIWRPLQTSMTLDQQTTCLDRARSSMGHHLVVRIPLGVLASTASEVAGPAVGALGENQVRRDIARTETVEEPFVADLFLAGRLHRERVKSFNIWIVARKSRVPDIAEELSRRPLSKMVYIWWGLIGGQRQRICPVPADGVFSQVRIVQVGHEIMIGGGLRRPLRLLKVEAPFVVVEETSGQQAPSTGNITVMTGTSSKSQRLFLKLSSSDQSNSNDGSTAALTRTSDPQASGQGQDMPHRSPVLPTSGQGLPEESLSMLGGVGRLMVAMPSSRPMVSLNALLGEPPGPGSSLRLQQALEQASGSEIVSVFPPISSMNSHVEESNRA